MVLQGCLKYEVIMEFRKVALRMKWLLLIVKVLFFVLMFEMMAFLLMLKEDKVSVKMMIV